MTNIGYEQDGKGNKFLRPVLILKKFNQQIFLGVPLSRTQKKSPYHFQFTFKERESNALLSQVRLFDAKQLADRSGRIGEKVFQMIKRRIRQFFT